MPILTENKDIKLMCSDHKVAKIYCQNEVIYSSGNIVTYHVSPGVTYQEEVDEGASCLYPKTFTPSLSGWTFVGWRGDASANANVHQSLVMGDAPITLYAVFRQAVTVTYYNGSTAASSTSGYRYYNSGNIANPSFTLTQAALSGWSARGWSTSAAANGGITCANGATFTRDSDFTLYGMYQQPVTLSYNGNGATGGSVSEQTGIRYYNSNGAVINPTFNVKANAFSYSNYTFVNWALNGVSGTRYAPNSAITLSSNATMYAIWIGTPFTWVSNYEAASGQSISATWHYHMSGGYDDRGTTTNMSKLLRNLDITEEGVECSFSTSGVQSRGLRKMVLTMTYYAGLSSGAEDNKYFRVYANGTLLYDSGNQILDKLTVDLPDSDVTVTIAGAGRAWAYNPKPGCSIQKITFEN